eukprot:748329-Rhodomonas_salina.1
MAAYASSVTYISSAIQHISTGHGIAAYARAVLYLAPLGSPRCCCCLLLWRPVHYLSTGHRIA